MSAEMIRTLRGCDSVSGSPAGITASAWRCSASASCSTRHAMYLRTPSENGVDAVHPSSRWARLEHTIFPPKSPGYMLVWGPAPVGLVTLVASRTQM